MKGKKERVRKPKKDGNKGETEEIKDKQKERKRD